MGVSNRPVEDSFGAANAIPLEVGKVNLAIEERRVMRPSLSEIQR